MSFMCQQLKQSHQLLDFLDIEAVVDNAEEEEDSEDEELGESIMSICAVSCNDET